MRNTDFRIVAFIAALFFKFSCAEKEITDLTKESLIPIPVSVTATGSSFELNENSAIYISGDSEELIGIGEYLADILRPSTGYNLPVNSTSQAPSSGNIYINLEGDEVLLGNEGYDLTITEDLITLSADQPAGLFYAVQTLRQLLPAKVENNGKQEGPWKISTGNIIDYPNYTYRGSMLDVGRHFFGVEDVKRYIDLIAAFKMNVFHLGLTNDQGWRIEIKSWPKLAEIGGSTEVGGGEAGFYTQEDYKEIVQYAAERYITVVPEFDMPGHTNAALASYPELNCDGKARDLYTGIEVGFSTLCTDKEITYEFLDDVIGEIAAITPGPYFHIGGDESHVTPMEDYKPFIARAEEIVHKHGKSVIGWDEIAHAELDPGSIAQVWARAENGKMAVDQGCKLILSPANKTYLDMQYDSTTQLGLHWAAYVEIDSSYIWDPAKLYPGIGKENILGIEAPLWTETITNMEEIEYMVFPRLPGIAEIAWSPASLRDWETYKVRLGKFASRFDNMDINYYASKQIPWVTDSDSLKTSN